MREIATRHWWKFTQAQKKIKHQEKKLKKEILACATTSKSCKM